MGWGVKHEGLGADHLGLRCILKWDLGVEQEEEDWIVDKDGKRLHNWPTVDIKMASLFGKPI